ncbi:multidrug transporter [Salinisphaera orenii MK-B5]|uniref:Efflux pump membrane transporter n=1 Tax=Salinisphaera orenii MK-B5 TaxID=856730 RepID=A0A423PFC0_9GAMM|nr:efflux RND transporter permease subunit [Salinisphaera orenii]ROO24288.1 multidrug transporter [Salinisphaera orenii MK-B5]
MAGFFIDRPIFAMVLAIVICLGGLLAIRTLPLEQYPAIAPPTISIAATYRGASAKTVQNSVTQVIEQEMTGLDNLLYMYSSSRSSGEARIRLTFAAGTNPDIAQVQVQNQLQSALARLPQPVQAQGVSTYQSGGDNFLVFALVSTDGSMTEADIGDYIASTLQDPLSRVDGVSQARNYGSEYALRIWLDPHRLNRFDLMPSDIAAAVETQNANVSAGELGGLPAVAGQQLYATVTARTRLTTVSGFENIILKSTADGAAVTLDDVARVAIGSDEYTENALFNGQPAAGLGLELAAGANAVATAAAVKERLRELEPFFPPGLEARVAFDTTPFVRASVKEVVKTLFEAILLVVVVMFLFLQSARATLIPTLAVPVVILGTFGVLALLGYSINTLTMFAIVLAIGLLVDDAIVVVENVERVMSEQGLDAPAATRRSMREISSALVGIALVLSAVFMPMAFFGGATGVIYRQFSVTIVSAMALSVLVALTLTPALCATLLRPSDDNGRARRFFGAFNRGMQWLTNGYERSVRWMIGHRWLSLAGFGLLLVAAALLFARLPSTFLPVEDQGVLVAQVQLPPGATAQRTLDAMRTVERYFRDRPNVESVFAIASDDRQNSGRAFIRLVDWGQRTGAETSASAIAAEASAVLSEIRDAQVYVQLPPTLDNLGESTGFQMELKDTGGRGRDVLTQAKDLFLERAEASGLLTQVRAQVSDPASQLTVDIDDAKARSLGVELAAINDTLSVALGGRYVDDFIYEGRVKRIFMQGAAPYRMQPGDIGDWYVRNDAGEMVPFGALTSLDWDAGLPELERYNGAAAYEITGQSAPGVSSSAAMAEVRRIVNTLPTGIGFEWSGLSLQQQMAGNRAPLLYGVSVLFVFLCLAALYESWSIPFSVMLVVPLGVLGALLAMTLRGLPADVYFQVGLLTTIGLSAKNAILIVEYASTLEREGWTLLAATRRAVRLRLRPILMTSLAFGMGVFPLVISSGAGAAARNSVGTGVFGGVIAATVLGILFVPLFFVLVRGGWRRSRRAPAPAAGDDMA